MKARVVILPSRADELLFDLIVPEIVEKQFRIDQYAQNQYRGAGQKEIILQIVVDFMAQLGYNNPLELEFY